uniref:SPARC/Testican calcium-binding domain-containing protein n=1 Tax=Parascaris equorum TaxID=6256 RepID=A0A914S3R1_PAREQ
MTLFKKEYDRIAYPQENLATPLDKRIILWKFGQLDTNEDGVLNNKEIGGFKRLVRKLAESKACARRFSRYCDLDKNNAISTREWITCLGVDLTSKLCLFLNQIR